MTPIEGVDYAWAPHPSPAALKAAGKHFAVRYGGPGTDGKHLHADELAGLKAAGIAIVANAEQAADSFRGAAAGKAHATSAQAMFKALGMPSDRPIYFSVDWDAGAKDWPAVDAALKGAASVIGAARVGVYGSYDTVAHCRAAGTARWFWQTYAWSGGKQPPSYVHLYQYRNNQRIGGASCDFVRALLPDFGQWGVNNTVEDDDMTVDELITALNSNTKLRQAVCSAVLNTDGVLNTPAGAGPASQKANPQWAAVSFLQNIYDASVSSRDRVTALAAGQDPAALAAALAPLLHDVDAGELQTAIVGALKQLAGDDETAPTS